ncbi:hypothetical protein [Streptomyces sp. NPDC056713]|uniref:hypothetical protein n=1 Tax=unclassified Streptomyces TaxID=2593676 RepID=UPI003683C789
MPQPEKQLNPDSSPEEWFGAEVRYWRHRQGLKCSELGSIIEKDEKGKYRPRRALVQELDLILDTGGVLDRS